MSQRQATMDFFEAQDRAKKRTSRLVLLFFLAVGATILAAYVAMILIVGANTKGSVEVWDPAIFAGSTLLVSAIVGLSSLFKWMQLSSGGKAVAEMVGGRRVDPGSRDLSERRLLNVVEEMAIASGVPVPAVYILEEEQAINAFAAGLTTSDAVVAVTRGTLNKLNRDELQGVVAHEFSHILNGDMRLNLRITVVLFGILVLGLLGRGILEVMVRGRVRSSGGKKGGGVAVVLLIGLALLIIGYVGYFFGRLIQAAVSRQREYLADASAVQFTRNPLGISRALQKIGGFELGSEMESTKAAQIGHFFFAQSFSSWFGGLFATHPPLQERIQAVDPTWNGKLIDPPDEIIEGDRSSRAPVSGFSGGTGSAPSAAQSRTQGAQPVYTTPSAPAPQAPRMAVVQSQLLAQAGSCSEQHFKQAHELISQLPETLRNAAREIEGAQALNYALVLAAQSEASPVVEALIQTRAGAVMAERAKELKALILAQPYSARLPLCQLSLASLRNLTPSEGDAFLATIEQATRADKRMSFFEFALERTLARTIRLSRKPNTRIDFSSFQAVAEDISRILSSLAWVGQADPDRASQAMSAGVAQLKLIESRMIMMTAAECQLALLAPALERLSRASLPIKKRTLVAAAYVIGYDGTISREEAELFRAIAASIDCPMPIWEEGKSSE